MHRCIGSGKSRVKYNNGRCLDIISDQLTLLLNPLCGSLCSIYSSSFPQHSKGMKLCEPTILNLQVASDARLESELLETLRKEVGWRSFPLEQASDMLSLLDILDKLETAFSMLCTHCRPRDVVLSFRPQAVTPWRVTATNRFVKLLDESADSQSTEWKWCSGIAEQSLLCSAKTVGLLVLLPEDVSHQTSNGEISMWIWQEFQLLEGTGEARRGPGFLCELASSDNHRPMETFTNFSSILDALHLGWPLIVPMGNHATKDHFLEFAHLQMS